MRVLICSLPSHLIQIAIALLGIPDLRLTFTDNIDHALWKFDRALQDEDPFQVVVIDWAVEEANYLAICFEGLPGVRVMLWGGTGTDKATK